MLLLLILPNNDFNSIARAFPSLVAYGFRHAQHMKWLTVLDKRARIRHTIESRWAPMSASTFTVACCILTSVGVPGKA